ncbi:MAG: mycothiol system anti-sigma-R factor [Candidatus Nanopelagicales bacterium]|nr:mycothiol system anti-sigma-R factor [Candidatus Nanopelagicales bacterium]
MNAETGGTPAGETGCPCSEADAHMWVFLDGELDQEHCSRIRAHIEQCAKCAERMRNDSRLKEMVARACRCEQAPPALRVWVEQQVAVWRFDAQC